MIDSGDDSCVLMVAFFGFIMLVVALVSCLLVKFLCCVESLFFSFLRLNIAVFVFPF